jgi:hypothetical protein
MCAVNERPHTPPCEFHSLTSLQAGGPAGRRRLRGCERRLPPGEKNRRLCEFLPGSLFSIPSMSCSVYRGDFLHAIESSSQDDLHRMVTDDLMAHKRARTAVSARLLLRAASSLEGWAVSLARWILEAALARDSQCGAPSELFEACRPSLDPPAGQLLEDVRIHGHVSRITVARAIGQCASHTRLWRTLANMTLLHTPYASGIGEFTRILWTPLHFAAAFPSANVMTDLLALAPADLVARANGVGYSPLHVAVAHDATQTIHALVATLPQTADVRDRQGRTARELALERSLHPKRCRALLAALRVPKTVAKKSCSIVARRRREMQHQPLLRIGPSSSCHSDDSGGWQPESTGGGLCASDLAEARGEHGPRRCDVPVRSSMDPASLIHDHLSAGVPVLVTTAMDHSDLCARWTRAAFVATHGEVLLPSERYPYADASAHLYGVPHAPRFAASHLIDSMSRANGSAVDGHRRRDGVFVGLLDGWRRISYRGDGREQRTRHGDIQLNTAGPDEQRREAPQRLLSDFERPPFVEDDQWLLRTETVQFYLGGESSGAQPHWHANAWNWLVHGRKRWFLWPAQEATYTQRHVLDAVGEQKAEPEEDSTVGSRGPLVCEQRGGEVLVVPPLWGHATVNLKPSIGWASELVFDRAYDDGLGETHGREWWRTGT